MIRSFVLLLSGRNPSPRDRPLALLTVFSSQPMATKLPLLPIRRLSLCHFNDRHHYKYTRRDECDSNRMWFTTPSIATTNSNTPTPSQQQQQHQSHHQHHHQQKQQQATKKTSKNLFLHTERLILPPHGDMDSTNNSETNRHRDHQKYSVVFLHGLLGSGRNLKTFAKKVLSSSSNSDRNVCHGGILVDLPGHGQSRVGANNNTNVGNSYDFTDENYQPYSFDQCGKDIDHTLRRLSGLARNDDKSETSAPEGTTSAGVTGPYIAPPRVLVGHSWGGRLALAYAARRIDCEEPRQQSSLPVLDSLWLLDTVPGVANESVNQVIHAVSHIQKLQLQQQEEEEQEKEQHQEASTTNVRMDRNQLIESLTTTYGIEDGIAQWLASSYNVRDGDFGFDLRLVKDIQPEFGSQDFWGLLRQILEHDADVDNIDDKNDMESVTTRTNTTVGTVVHLVRGGKNMAWTVPILNKIQRLQKEFPSKFFVHVLPASGHWVHIDDPSLADRVAAASSDSKTAMTK